MSTEYVGSADLPPDRYLGPTRYRIRYRCARCGKEWSRVTTKVSSKDPPCPKLDCREALIAEAEERGARRMQKMLEERLAPAQVGASNAVKAVDVTAEIVMKDHKMTDLADNLREGDIAAPKLPPQMQAAVDGFFTGDAVRKRSGLSKKSMDLIGKRALAGAYRNMALNPGNIIPGTRGEPALRSVGKTS